MNSPMACASGRFARSWLLHYCCLFATAAAAAASDDPVGLAVAGLQRRYASVRAVSANFEQTYRAPGVEQTESGILWMQKPGLMRWQYRVPETKLFIADGRETFLYAPEDRQVLVRRFSASDLHSTPLQFLLGQGEISNSYSASWEMEGKRKFEGTLLLRLVPRSPEPEYAYVILECDAKTFDLRRLVVRERGGNTSEFVLSNMVANPKVDKKQFQFRIPRGVEVVRLDER